MIKYTLLALISGALSGFGSYLYASVYQELTVIDYSAFIPSSSIFISCFIGCILASAGHALFVKFLPKIGDIIFGFLFAIISFTSILGVFKATLPDSDDESFYYLISVSQKFALGYLIQMPGLFASVPTYESCKK